MACRTRFHARTLLACLALVLALPAAALARGGEPQSARVPDVRRLRTADARGRIEAAGFKVGKVYELSRERVLRVWKVRYPVGYVFMQAPSFTEALPIGTPIHLVVVAARDGPELPPNMPALKEEKRAPKAPPPDDRVPPPVPPPGREQERAPSPELAEGSPDAPRVAPKADPNVVPPLTGLDLAQAEQLVRAAGMTLYVERVGGHPVGRVLEQFPAARSKRPAGGVIKVIATAGGDFAGEAPGAPQVYLAEIEVPNLLDRTVLQARRILEALGLKPREEQAKRGLPGRVVDQMPMEGGKVPKGGVVRIWIGPGEPETAADDGTPRPPPGALRPDGSPQAEGRDPKADPPAPLAPGPLAAGVPAPVAPGADTVLPKEDAVPVGFTWRGVQGADAYILEIEEQGAEGAWIPSARTTARKTAALVEIERLDPRKQKRLRWRVRAVIGGKQGTPSAWVPLR